MNFHGTFLSIFLDTYHITYWIYQTQRHLSGRWQVIFGLWKKNSRNDFMHIPVELCSFLPQDRVELNILGSWKIQTLIFWFCYKMNLLEETIEEDIHHSRKIGSCCRMYFYYEINVWVEVEGYLVLIFERILSIFKKNYLKEQCYNTIMKNSLPRKIIFCEVHNDLLHEHKIFMGVGWMYWSFRL